MTKDEAMQMALDANTALLEFIGNTTKSDFSSALAKATDANKALRAALAQPEHWSDCAVYNEPAYPAGECDCKPTKLINVNGVLEQAGYVKQKEWVGLTDEEINAVDNANWDKDDKSWGIRKFARGVEAKLKEKNA